MKRKFLSLLLVVFTGLLFLTVGALTAADVPDEVNIENQGYKSNKKGPVKLSHKKHSADYKIACADCHHDYKDGKNVWKEGDPVKKCGDCHDPKKKQGKTMKLKNAYHKNCKNCHKDLGKAGKPTGPFKKCNDCHAKK
jgi:class III cytochrome C family protein